MNPRAPVPFRGVALRCLLLLTAFMASAHAETPADPPPASSGPPKAFQVSYELRHNSMLLARMERRLRAGEDGTWIYESQSSPAGLIAAVRRDRITESSVWHDVDGRPRPLHYEYHHTGRGANRHVGLAFDWRKGTVVNTVNGAPWSMAIPDLTLDKLLYQYALMRDLQNGAQELRYLVADGGGLKTYRFERLGNETVKTPLGHLETVKLQRVEGGHKTIIWCAPRYGYMPVRVEQHRDRKVATLTISAIRMD